MERFNIFKLQKRLITRTPLIKFLGIRKLVVHNVDHKAVQVEVPKLAKEAPRKEVRSSFRQSQLSKSYRLFMDAHNNLNAENSQIHRVNVSNEEIQIVNGGNFIIDSWEKIKLI